MNKYTVILMQVDDPDEGGGEPAFSWRQVEAISHESACNMAINSYVADNCIPEELWDDVKPVYIIHGLVCPVTPETEG